MDETNTGPSSFHDQGTILCLRFITVRPLAPETGAGAAGSRLMVLRTIAEEAADGVLRRPARSPGRREGHGAWFMEHGTPRTLTFWFSRLKDRAETEVVGVLFRRSARGVADPRPEARKSGRIRDPRPTDTDTVVHRPNRRTTTHGAVTSP